MTDHAKVISKALDERFRNRMPDGDTLEWDTYAALDALVAELDEARRQVRGLMRDPDENVRWLNLMEERAEAAEAERDALRAELRQGRVDMAAAVARVAELEAEVVGLQRTVAQLRAQVASSVRRTYQ